LEGDLYEPYVGRWSRLVAREFLAWLAVPEGMEWLDVGCGTGALSQTILERQRPRRLKGIDPSPEFIAHARSRMSDGVAVFDIGDAQALPDANDRFDCAVSGLVLNFVPDPLRAVTEMARVLRPAGLAALYVWDYGKGMELIRIFWDAAIGLDPAAAGLDEARRFPLCRPEPLVEVFSRGGLRDVEVRAIDVLTDFQDFDDYWSPFLGGQGPAPGYAMSLDESRRAALRERIRSRLPESKDGSIHLNARAWAVRGRTA
jgi:SAM-dependent methyltransferase